MTENDVEFPAAPEVASLPPSPTAAYDLSAVVIPLLKGVVYKELDASLWNALYNLQTRVRDYVSVLGLDLVLDEAEGYAFLQSRLQPIEVANDTSAAKLPRLIARRPLSFPVSLLLALLRKKLAEFDAGGADTRLILSLEQIVDIMRVFLPEKSNEAKLVDQLETHLNKIVELGFVRRLKPTATPNQTAKSSIFEVRRILKAFIDAQWLADFDARLDAYRTQLQNASEGIADE